MTTAVAVRAAGSALDARAEQLDDACRALAGRLVESNAGWRGLAADAAAERAQELTVRTTQASDALASGAAALRTCAAELADADALSRRADQLARHHEDAELVAAAQRLRAEAGAATELALHRAALALQELRPPAPPHRSQLAGFGHGLWGVLADTGRQAWTLDPHLIALHPRAWWSTVNGNAAGLLQVVEHPRAALTAAAGLDQLRDHAYGEWAGTMLGTAVTGFDTGGAGRIAGVGRRLERGALIVAEDGSWTVRHRSTLGGRVRPAAAAALPRVFPRRIKDLTHDRIQHILVGDDHGGGHRSGVGRPGKTEFPPTWSDDDIVRRAMGTAMHPESIVLQDNGNYRLERRFGDVTVRAVVAHDGSVITAHPLKGGTGVVHNRRRMPH